MDSNTEKPLGQEHRCRQTPSAMQSPLTRLPFLLLHIRRIRLLRRSLGRQKPTGNLHPLGNTTALFALYIHDIRVAPTPATHAVFLLWIPFRPVVVLLLARFLVQRGELEVWLAGQLARRRVRRTVLDGGVSVTEVTEVVDLRGGEQGAGGEGVDGCVTPLGQVSPCIK